MLISALSRCIKHHIRLANADTLTKLTECFILQTGYLTKFGYLPESDLETGNLQTEDQLRNALRTLQVILLAGFP